MIDYHKRGIIQKLSDENQKLKRQVNRHAVKIFNLKKEINRLRTKCGESLIKITEYEC